MSGARPRTPAGMLAAAVSTLVQRGDLTDTVARLIAGCQDALAAQAVGVLLRDAQGKLDLLGATSHRITELELFQIQQDNGPCLEAIECADQSAVAGAAAIIDRWPVVGARIVESGFLTVQAHPLIWNGTVLGAMNVFYRSDREPSDEQRQLGQAFADMLCILVVQTVELSAVELSERVQRALHGRTIVEQAKGVLAYRGGIDMAQAYDVLVHTAAAHGRTITEYATGLVEPGPR
jgi:hypothetical protein